MVDQQIIGATIVAVSKRIMNSKIIFDKIKEYKYDDVKPDKWYPMQQFTLLTDYVEKIMNASVLNYIGKQIVPEMKDAKVISFPSPKDFLKSMQKVYLAANKGANIGEWKVVKEETNKIVVKSSTMHNCYLEQGVLQGGVEAFGGKSVIIKHSSTECRRKGGKSCDYEIRWN